MAKFLTGKELTNKVYDIIWNAEQNLVIVSPYIKLDDYFKQIFLKHKNNHKLHILIIFGKNEGTPSKSLRSDDFDFFKQFKNISVVYCKDLHAKYYGNDKEGVVTSINLYDTNFEKNLEYGVSHTMDILDAFKHSFDKEAYQFSWKTTEISPAIFIKRPVYEKALLGLTKTYFDSEVLLDQTDDFMRWRRWESGQKHFYKEYPNELSSTNNKTVRPERPNTVESKKPEKNFLGETYPKDAWRGKTNQERSYDSGYCIRTGAQIPFDPARPLSYDAYQSWSQFNNPDYPENFCHRTGKKSFGKTTVRNPILV